MSEMSEAKNSTEPSGRAAGRERASAVMRNRAERLREEARAWDALARLVENNLEPGTPQESAIWSLACRRF